MSGLILLLLASASAQSDPQGEIAFMRAGRVWITRTDGQPPRALTEELRYKADRPLAFSADGSRLLYWSHSEHGWDIWSIELDSGKRTNLTQTRTGGCRSASWSPDGTRIAFMRDEPTGLYVMDADGANPRHLTRRGHRDEIPAWSPDGQSILFGDLRSTGDNAVVIDVYCISAEGHDERRIRENASDPFWVADGSKVLIVARRGRASDLCLVHLDGTNERNLTSSPEVAESNPVLSPDGQWIAYFATHHASNQAGKTELRLIDLSGQQRVLAEVEGHADKGITWSPDGRRLAFVSGAKGRETIFTIDIAGQNQSSLTGDGAQYPAWRPQPR